MGGFCAPRYFYALRSVFYIFLRLPHMAYHIAVPLASKLAFVKGLKRDQAGWPASASAARSGPSKISLLSSCRRKDDAE